MVLHEDLAEIFKCNKVTKETRGLFLAFKMYRRLGRLKKYLKTETPDFKSMPDEAMWLKENFPRLEETVREDIGIILRLSHILKNEKYPLFYEVFEKMLQRNIPQGQEEMQELFALCNNYGEGLDYNNSLSLIPLLRAATEMELCGIFISLFNDVKSCNGQRIGNLFSLLDILASMPREKVLSTNKTEEILMSENVKIYEKLTDETKRSYRRNLIKIAKEKKLSQTEAAKQIADLCNQENEHIGKILRDKANGGVNYLLVLLFLTISFTILLCLVSPVFLLFVIPVYYSTNLIVDKFFSKYLIKPFVLPQIRLNSVPENCGVMTVITTLLFGEKEDRKIFDSLEKSYLSCGGENIYFGVLADLTDSDERMTEKDEKILENANLAVRRLRERYGNVFFLFVRGRVWSNSEEKYIAPERKRGAVCSLASFLCGTGDDFADPSIKPNKEICENVKYILTLDADTNLGFDCIKELAGIGLHPQNEPYFDKEKGVVTRGYGIIQPEVSTTVDSAFKNYFTRIMCGHAGIDNYSFGGSDKNMSLYGQSFFCGKGLIEKNVFNSAFCGENMLKNEAILSHDAVEGAVLRCAFTNAVYFTDSYPSQMLSYFKRKHRWMRGDFQNMPFLFSRVNREDGRKEKIRHSIFSRFFIFQNAVNALFPVFCLAMLIASPFCKDDTRAFLITIALSNLILPFVNTVLSVPYMSLWQNFSRIFYSKDLYTGIWTSFMQTVFCISTLPKTALVSLDALVRVIYRGFVSHKKMLEWTTFSQSDGEAKDGILGFVKKNLVCAIFGTFLFAATDNGILKVVSLLWFFCPYFAYRFSKTSVVHDEISNADKDTLTEYCRDMWSFFAENVNRSTNFLPPDNISFYPETKLADYTSPTNMGFYILCIFVARKLGLIDSKELEMRLNDTLKAAVALPKYNGLLYNWYNVKNAMPLNPRYVSSVDIGNCLACLICAKSALCEFADELKAAGEIGHMLDLLCNIDITPLYDFERQQFFIGGTDENGELVLDKNRYDMLMSEARLLSFVSIADKSIPVHHIKHLSRPFTESWRHIGLASWSGTAFEYFLPEIFIKSKEGTLFYEALSFSYNCAKESGVNTKYGRVFGISESLYNELDDNRNYKYFAFGTSKNALRVTEEKRVISPYSAFLFLPMSRYENMKNLSALRGLGCYGRYGFYDSIDFERNGVVKSVMSHHIGMSMCAAANEICGGVVRGWFAKNKQMGACLELFEEKLPYEMRIKKLARKVYDFQKNSPFAKEESVQQKEGENKEEALPLFCSGRKIYCRLSKNSLGKTALPGEGWLTSEEKLLFNEDFDLAANGENLCIADGAFIFMGIYKNTKYEAEVLCDAQKAFKLIFVRSRETPAYSFGFNGGGVAKIGSGAVFVQHEDKVDFCYGFMRQEEKITGADYVIEDRIRVHFAKEENVSEYVFCVGRCDSFDDMVKIQGYVSKKYFKIGAEAGLLSKSLVIDANAVPEKLQSVLGEYGYEIDKVDLRRIYTDIPHTDRLFLSLLLLFSDHGIDKETVLNQLKDGCSGWLEDLLCCLIFASFINVKKDMSAADEALGKTTAYLVFLKKVFSISENCFQIEKNKQLYNYSIEEFAKACVEVRDFRMGQRIHELLRGS